jgi:Na+-translocating ferredoxin:NAD+ oxidoreductase subunit G
MAGKESTFKNMLVTLFAVTFIASASLGLIYNLTKDDIAKAKELKKSLAIIRVLPEFNNNPDKEHYTVKINNDSLVFYPAKKEGKLVGTAVETFSNNGFSGKIRLMVGLLPDGTINNITVLENKETAGLGDKISKAKSDWSDQFNHKNPRNYKLEVVKDGGDVDAITASTISSRAYWEAVKLAYDTYMKGGQK